MRKVQIFIFIVLVSALTVSLAFAAEGTFKANLSGYDSVPAVKTKAKGYAEFKLSKGGKALNYKLVSYINNVNAAHIHKGKKGENGPVVAGLFAGPKKEGIFNGTLSEGVITEKELMGELEGKSLDALVQLIKSGDLFVNVHTTAYPDGEIRGQIK
jgi:hypothetical protein